MENLIAQGRALPAYAALPATAASLLLIILAMRATPGRATKYVLFAIWLRFILSAFHPYTFSNSPLGPTWNALASLVICTLGLLVLRRRRILDAGLIPFYLIFLAILTSGVINHRMPDTIDMLIKYIYLAVLTLTTADALEENGWEFTLSRMVIPFMVPFGFQALSVLLGVSKVTELDGSISYIGGFAHEAGFSLSLAGGLLLVCLMRTSLTVWAKIGLVGLCFGGILLANYRTAIVGLAPLIGASVLIGAVRMVVPRQRPLVVGLISLAVLGAGAGAAVLGENRFADIGTLVTRNTDLIHRVESYPEQDRHIMSGRPLIWSGYIYGYADSSPIQHMIGVGPNVWKDHFKVYAHNTLLSALYELGLFGVVAMSFLWAWMLGLACAVRSSARPMLIGAHLSFFILNMATMPMWMIEGMIYYGLLCGATLYYWQVARRHQPPGRASSSSPSSSIQPRCRPAPS
ncbi:hypothetical protein BV96_03971 [Sphingomonas paucimobilis]|nr:hypothetical protein BV96_03971 [Sphingomonas paucimobilis]